MHTFQPWQELAESESMKFNYMMLNDMINSDILQTGTDHHGITDSKVFVSILRPNAKIWHVYLSTGMFEIQLKLILGS